MLLRPIENRRELGTESKLVLSMFAVIIAVLVLRSYDLNALVAKFTAEYEHGPKSTLIQLNTNYVRRESQLEKVRVAKEKASRKDLALFTLKTDESSPQRFHE